MERTAKPHETVPFTGDRSGRMFRPQIAPINTDYFLEPD